MQEVNLQPHPSVAVSGKYRVICVVVDSSRSGVFRGVLRSHRGPHSADRRRAGCSTQRGIGRGLRLSTRPLGRAVAAGDKWVGPRFWDSRYHYFVRYLFFPILTGTHTDGRNFPLCPLTYPTIRGTPPPPPSIPLQANIRRCLTGCRSRVRLGCPGAGLDTFAIVTVSGAVHLWGVDPAEGPRGKAARKRRVLRRRALRRSDSFLGQCL